MPALQRAVGEDALPVEREAGLVAYAALAREGGRLAEPFLLPMLPAVLACHADKVGHWGRLLGWSCIDSVQFQVLIWWPTWGIASCSTGWQRGVGRLRRWASE